MAALAATFVVFYFANIAQAGFFSFAGGLLEIKQPSQDNEKIINTQTISLLGDPFNYEISSAKGGGDVIVVNNNSLLPESGPLGTIADIEEDVTPNSEQISIYVVREGDNLYQIAKMFNVSVNTIIWANDIKRGDRINPGQILTILPVSGVKYEVKKGDTAQSIARKLKGDVDDIISFNDLEAGGQLSAGQIIIVPNGEQIVPQYATPSGGGKRSPYYAGYYLRPISGGVKTQGIHGYNGVDLANSCGAPIMAAANGSVIISKSGGWNAGYGNYVVISHPNGTQTLYSHLNKNIVFSGWNVVQGQVIGYIGSTGKSTGCHVHFEIRGAQNPF